MTKQGLLLIGAGGHAKSCIDVIELEDKYQVVGLVGVQNEVGSYVLGYEVLGTDEDLPKLLDFCQFALIGIGQIGVTDLRYKTFRRCTDVGFKLPSVISPKAYVSPHASIGKGTIIMHHAVINAGARVGDNCIINSTALIEHDVAIDDHCHIATGAIINGGSSVGSSSFIGSGSEIRESIAIGNHCLIGMGVSIRNDLPPNTRVAGN